MTTLLLAAAISSARWIGVDAPIPEWTNGVPDTACFVHSFTNAKPVVGAEWTVSGLGVFEARVNGRLAAEDVLEPGFTHVAKRRQCFTHDVAPILSKGAGEVNVLSAMVSTGWWRDEIVNNPFGSRNRVSAFRGALRVKYEDGTEETVATDESWKAAYAGPVVHASIYWGETYDARADVSWTTAGAPGWRNAREVDCFAGETSDGSAARIVLRRDLELRPVAAYAWSGVEGADDTRYGKVRVIRRYSPGDEMSVAPGETLVVDFGQNAVGMPEIAAEAAAGVSLFGHPAEMLNDSMGERSRRNDGPAGSAYVENYRLARSTATYVFAGRGVERYRPAFTFFGGRYFSFTATGRVSIKALSFVPASSVTAESETGFIKTGRDDVNRLVSNCVWGMRGNYLSVPTDCPQRDERQGWSGDGQVFSAAAVYIADVYDFLSKWMLDMRDSQIGDDPRERRYAGAFRNVSPVGACGIRGHMIGWGDAGVIIPYRAWRHYGDLSMACEHYTAMRKFMELVLRTKYATGPKERQCCDWLSAEKLETWRMLYGLARGGEGPRPGETEADMRRLWDFHGLCQLADDARMMREMAAAIGRSEDAAKYAAAESEVKALFKARHLTADGLLDPLYDGMQTPAAMALVRGMLPSDEARRRVAEALVANVKSGGYRIRTGFLGTAILLDALSDFAGDAECAYSVLLQHGNPGWLYTVDQGATTIWERWDGYTREKGFGPSAMNSFNHYAYGAVLGWLYRTAAGIRPGPDAPGFSHFTLRPRPDRRLGSVEARCRTRQGVVESAWRYDDDGACRWRFAIPRGTVATVYSGGSEPEELGEGTYERTLVAAARPWANAEELADFRGYHGATMTNNAAGFKTKRFWANEEKTDWRDSNYDERAVRPYSLEDPLVFADGRKVETEEDWRKRRAEMLSIFESEVYGRLPPKPDHMIADLVKEELTEDRFSIRRTYRQYFRKDRSGPVIDWLVIVPRFAKGRVPVILHLNYKGNDLVASGKTNHYTLPLEHVAARGYAFMSAHYTQITADPKNRKEWDERAYDGVFELWGPRDPARTDNPGAIMAWAWGLMRGLDLAETVKEIDATRNVVIGSSRLGKAALLAGAFDERFKVVIPNQTGAAGVQLIKRDFGENPAVQHLMFPHWYCRAYWKYEKDPTTLQHFDQHMLLACVAPRALLLECFMSPWFDPKGEFASAVAASPVWEKFAGKGLGCSKMPERFCAEFARPPLGYVVRGENHGLSGHDWMWALDFADAVLK